MLLVVFRLAFTTIILPKLTTKPGDLGISTSLCSWMLDFLNTRPQQCTHTLHHHHPPHRCSTGLSLVTHDCRFVHGFESTVKCADDTTVISLITDNGVIDLIKTPPHPLHIKHNCIHSLLLVVTVKFNLIESIQSN